MKTKKPMKKHENRQSTVQKLIMKRPLKWITKLKLNVDEQQNTINILK